MVPILGLHFTVCRQALQGFSEEVSNHQVRKLLKIPVFMPECFLRVEIAEEDGRVLFGTELTSSIETHFRNKLVTGIELNRHPGN
jgi:hypothetical protein